jgi:hypothetical protein
MSKDDRLGPTRLTGEQIGRKPRKDQPLVELRFVNPDGETEVWMLGTAALPWEDDDFRAAIRMAYLDHGVDMRLKNQRDAIDRLLKHVQHHHADISVSSKNSGYSCDYQPDPS